MFIPTWVEQGKRKAQLLVECGAGKSSLAVLYAYELKRLGIIDKVCWAVPRLNLAKQGAKVFLPDSFVWELIGIGEEEAKEYEIMHLEDGNTINPSKGTFGYGVSYQAIASNPDLHIHEFKRYRYLLIRDEPQFARTDRALGNAIERLSQFAAFDLVMSGDYDTNDNSMVAAVDYIQDQAKSNHWVVDTDLYYSLTDALSDNAILPIYFGYGDGRAAYEYKEEYFEFSSFDEVKGENAKVALRAILKSEYAIELLMSCYREWMALRETGITRDGTFYPAYPAAQLLVVCYDQKQAKAMYGRLLADDNVNLEPEEVQLIISDDERSNVRLERFCDNKPMDGNRLTVKVAITVAMAYVGTDAPDVTHICCLTHYRSAPWIHQMLARAWRKYRDNSYGYHEQYCVAFVPRDPMLEAIIKHIRAMRQLGFFERDYNGDGAPGGGTPAADLMLTEYGELTELLHRQEFGQADYIDREFGQLAKSLCPDSASIRSYLLGCGIPAAVVDEMLAIYDKRSRPKPRPKTAAEQQAEMLSMLEDYQKETVRLVLRACGVTERDNGKFQSVKRLVSGKLKTWNMGHGPKELDIDQLRKSYMDRAPRIREEVLLMAQRGEIKL